METKRKPQAVLRPQSLPPAATHRPGRRGQGPRGRPSLAAAPIIASFFPVHAATHQLRPVTTGPGRAYPRAPRPDN